MIKKLFSIQTLVGVLLVFLAVGIFCLRPNWNIAGDGYGYYGYLRSLYFDHDLQFENELRYYDTTYHTDLLNRPKTAVGKYGNPFAIGMSIFLVPWFGVARLTEIIFSLPPSTLPGFSVVYNNFLAVATIVYSLFGVGFLYAGLARLVNQFAAWVSSLAIVFTTPLVHYVIYEPHMSHGLSFALSAVVFYISVRLRQAVKIKNSEIIFLSLAMTAMVLVRWQNLLVGILPALVAWCAYREKRVSWQQITRAAVVFFIGLLPQLAVWRYLYGSWLVVPQNTSGTHFIDLFHPQIWSVLFSGWHGLFSWQPLVLLYIICFIFYGKKSAPWLWCSALVIFAAEVYLNASVRDWWGGFAFGQRKMDSCWFIFACGLAFFLEKYKQRKIVLGVSLVVLAAGALWNVHLMISAARGYISLENPVAVGEIYRLMWRI